MYTASMKCWTHVTTKIFSIFCIFSDKKEVVLVDKTSGDMFTGAEACEMVGAGGAGRIKPTALNEWRVFVQSTSYNRVLMPGTGFLYEVDEEH